MPTQAYPLPQCDLLSRYGPSIQAVLISPSWLQPGQVGSSSGDDNIVRGDVTSSGVGGGWVSDILIVGGIIAGDSKIIKVGGGGEGGGWEGQHPHMGLSGGWGTWGNGFLVAVAIVMSGWWHGHGGSDVVRGMATSGNFSLIGIYRVIQLSLMVKGTIVSHINQHATNTN